MIKKLKIFYSNSIKFNILRKSILRVFLLLTIIFEKAKLQNVSLINSDCDINLHSV